ncbi:MAG: hypothetical protein RML12_07830 [Xanthomonadales bacterium]|nr:hypothetical protein [Xanthomonadales bacterium]
MYGLLATFLILCGAGIAAAGLAGYLIFAPLARRQSREHGIVPPGGSAFSPAFLRWLLGGTWRELGDPAIAGLAAPARLLAVATLAGSLLALAALVLGRPD